LLSLAISAGEKVAMYFVSGNRDDAYFVNPYHFTIDRTPNPHLAFGQGGPHFCLGNFVARMQIRIMLEELAKRVSSFELTGPVDRLRSNHIHGVKALHIALHPI
jgi:cytochrome P450